GSDGPPMARKSYSRSSDYAFPFTDGLLKLGLRGRAHGMKRTYLFVVAVAVSLALVESAKAYPRGGGRSFSGGGSHFSGGHYSAPHYSGGSSFRSSGSGYRPSASAYRPSGSGYRSSAPGRNYSQAAARHYGPRTSAMPNNRNVYRNNPRTSPTSTGVRNPTYAGNGRRFNGNRTTAFNSQNSTRSRDRVMAGNTSAASRSQAFNRNRNNIVARHSGNWRNWDRHRDHYWNGHRCHFHGGYWYIYNPFPFYP